MDTERITELLEKDLKECNRKELKAAYNYCVARCLECNQRDIVFSWWWNLRERIGRELEER